MDCVEQSSFTLNQNYNFELFIIALRDGHDNKASELLPFVMNRLNSYYRFASNKTLLPLTVVVRNSHYTCKTNDFKLKWLKKLLSLGARIQPNSREFEYSLECGNSTLFEAIKSGCCDNIIHLLLENGANPNDIVTLCHYNGNKYYNALLYSLLTYNSTSPEVCYYLVIYGADSYVVNEKCKVCALDGCMTVESEFKRLMGIRYMHSSNREIVIKTYGSYIYAITLMRQQMISSLSLSFPMELCEIVFKYLAWNKY